MDEDFADITNIIYSNGKLLANSFKIDDDTVENIIYTLKNEENIKINKSFLEYIIDNVDTGFFNDKNLEIIEN